MIMKIKKAMYIDNVGKVTTGEYPLLLQYDKKMGIWNLW